MIKNYFKTACRNLWRTKAIRAALTNPVKSLRTE